MKKQMNNQKKNFQYMTGLVLVLLLSFFILHSGHAQLPSFLSDDNESAKDPIQYSWQKTRAGYVFQVRIQPGYGIKRGKKYSFVKFYKKKNNRRQKIFIKPVTGAIAKQDKAYFSRANAMIIPRKYISGAQQLQAHVQVLFCSFDKGMCYSAQKKVPLDL